MQKYKTRKVITASVRKDLVEKLNEISERKQYPKSRIIDMALEMWMKKEEKNK